jgi:hypothetical protein
LRPRDIRCGKDALPDLWQKLQQRRCYSIWRLRNGKADLVCCAYQWQARGKKYHVLWIRRRVDQQRYYLR